VSGRLRAFYFLYFGYVGASQGFLAPYLRGLGFSGDAIGAVAMAAQLVSAPAGLFWAHMADLREAVKGDDAEAIRAKTNALAQASMKLGEAMYAQAQAGTAGGGEARPDAGAAQSETKEDVVDAEFTEVDDDKKNKKSA